MHTDNIELEGRTKVLLDQVEALALYNKAHQFDKQFQKMQLEFSQSPQNVYFIVSSTFIAQWREYCLSPEPSRFLPFPMNSDIFENGELKSGLVEKEDFELVNQSIYDIFKPFTDPQMANKREAVLIGNQKRVPIYLSTYKFVIVTFDILKEIDFNRMDIQNFKLKTIKLSESITFENFLQIVKDQEKIPPTWKIRLWLSQKQLTAAGLYRLIKKQLKPCSLVNYKVQGVGKRLQDLQAKLSEIMIEDEAFFICQVRQPDERFIFVKDNEGRCEGCNHFAILDFPCGCQKVKYCSQKCLEKDKIYHTRSCSYAEQMQLNARLNMKRHSKNNNGLVGLSNLGNTCFMNSCLQCLSHTVPLTNYFLQQHFEAEINKKNKIGFKGKLAKNYAKFIKAMWCDEDKTYAPYSIKGAVSDINPMFSGYAQHDSQQFFSFLADGLHEDLNRIQNKPYVPSVQEENKTQVDLARQSWSAHLKRNQSIITDIMCGQYRSIVTCPDCNHKSTTFDPFTTVSLTIPQSIESVGQFFHVHGTMEKKTKHAWFKYTSTDPNEWNRKACQATGADPSKCFLYLVSAKENIYRVGRGSMSEIVHKIQNQNKNLFLMEMTNQQLAVPQQNLLQFAVRLSKIGFSSYSRSEELFFKIPMFFDRQKLDGLMLYKRVLRFLYPQAYDHNKNRKSFLGWGGKQYEEYQKQMLKKRPFKLLLRLGKKIQRILLKIQVDYRKQIQIQDQNIIYELLLKENVKPEDCELDARFQKNKIEDFTFDNLKNFQTIGKPPKTQKDCSEIELQKCLESFSSPEILETGNEWYCPKCKEHKLAQKQLSIYRAPKILILHLKRFKHKGSYKKQKNQTLIRFPNELDLSPYLIDKRPMQAYKQEVKQNIYIRPKAENLPLIMSSTNSKPVYELYAISNHYGGLGGGHYTAYAKNNGQWFEFDDSRVSSASKKDIVSSNAYILFYERKQ